MSADTRDEWLVMDARAVLDPDSAVVLEAYGHQRPSMKRLRRDWGDQDACLCVAPGGKGIEFVERIP
jgi:hypothetical protein